MISKGLEYFEDYEETSRLGHNYITPAISPEVRSRFSSQKGILIQIMLSL